MVAYPASCPKNSMFFGQKHASARCDGAARFSANTLNLIEREKSGKTSVDIKCLKAGWNTDCFQTSFGLWPP